VILEDCSPSQLKRYNEIFASWYKIYLDWLYLLVPRSKKIKDRKVRVGDIVLFIFRDAMISELNVWKLARVVEIVSTHSVKLQYSLAGRPKKYV
jgi:hypothetical protein